MQSKVLKKWCFSVLSCFCSILSVLIYRLFPVALVALWFSEVVKGPRLHPSKIILRLLLCLNYPQQQQQTVYNQSSNQCLTRSRNLHWFPISLSSILRGRFGIVKKCVELNTATRFCAKFIKSRPSQKEEFKREVDVMNVLHHPRLIRLYDAFEESRQIVLIME